MAIGLTRCRVRHYRLEMRCGRLRNIVPWASVVVLGVLAAGGGWLGVAEQRAPSSAVALTVYTFGRNQLLLRFAGYYDVGAGPFTQISAKWKVPLVLSGSAPGAAASQWVGLLSTHSGAFVQLGTKEIVGSSDAPTSYRAVWSDTHLGYKAQALMVVVPGDVIEAAMSRVAGGWRLYLTDLTQARSVDFVIRYAAHTRFTTADWMEEDSSGPFLIDPFPRLSPITYRQLRLNGEAVLLAGTTLTPTILQAPDGIDVVPTRLHDDSFTNGEPFGRTASYVDDVAPFSLAVEDFLADAAQAVQASDPVLFPTPAVTPRTTSTIARLVARESSTQAIVAAKQVIRAERHLREHLAQSRSTVKNRQIVSELVQDATAAIGSLEAAVASYDQSRSWTMQELYEVVTQSQGVGRQLQRLVGLPA